MAKANYTVLVDQLCTITNSPSDSGNRSGYNQARTYILNSGLDQNDKDIVCAALHTGADTNQGYYYNSNGVVDAIAAIGKLDPANDGSVDPEPPKSITLSQFIQKVDNGRIFGVKFLKRTTGELRTMSCRLGVKKFLRGGQLAFCPAEKQLLTVFDMVAKGYRSIPLDGVRSVSVDGQIFSINGDVS